MSSVFCNFSNRTTETCSRGCSWLAWCVRGLFRQFFGSNSFFTSQKYQTVCMHSLHIKYCTELEHHTCNQLFTKSTDNVCYCAKVLASNEKPYATMPLECRKSLDTSPAFCNIWKTMKTNERPLAKPCYEIWSRPESAVYCPIKLNLCSLCSQ